MKPTNKPVVSSGIGKLFVAILVFVVVFGGWLSFRYVASVREAREPLPEIGGKREACMLWFIGSSSMRNWTTLATDMAPWDARNRGIGGATMDEITSRFENETPGPLPRAIIYYAGENDIAFGVSAEQAIAQLRAFIAAKRRRMGQLPLLLMSLKPSPTRWDDRPTQASYNAAARRIAETEQDIGYIDIVPSLLIDGKPGPFYVDDGIHMNAAGYAMWAAAIRSALPRELPLPILRQCGVTAGKT
ncbi:MAG: GDSL-type esterase/lipase family protein [Sphingomonas sp.]